MRHFICVIGVAFCMMFTCVSANAIMISESVYATVAGVNGADPTLVGNSFHLFDVVYDNEGATAHNYNLDGSVNYEYNIDNYANYTFFDDAEFTLSPFVTGLINDYGGSGGFSSYSDMTHGYSYPDGTVQTGYSTRRDDYYLWIDLNKSEDGQIFINSSFTIYGEGQDVEIIFGDPGYAAGGAGAPVPEPATMLLLGAGFISIAGFGRRLKNKNRRPTKKYEKGRTLVNRRLFVGSMVQG